MHADLHSGAAVAAMAGRARQARTAEDKQAREAAIRAAALEVFIEKGFAEARLDDVAARAGVAKGTIYLYFASKEALFEALVRAAVSGPIAEFEAKFLASGLSAQEGLGMLFGWFSTGMLAGDRKKIVGLVLSEARNFPQIAEFYHREVVSKALAMLRGIVRRGRERNEPIPPELELFPHLIVAPAILGVIWDMLFARHDTLDVPAMMRAHLGLLQKAGQGEAR